MSTTPSTTTKAPATLRREGTDGFTSATPTIYIGSDVNLRAYRADDGDLQVDISDGTHYIAAIRLTSDKGEAAFLAALASVPGVDNPESVTAGLAFRDSAKAATS